MVKINYSWNAEIPNTGPHADNDTKSVRRRETAKEREREGDLGPFQGSSTITFNRSIIDLKGVEEYFSSTLSISIS